MESTPAGLVLMSSHGRPAGEAADSGCLAGRPASALRIPRSSGQSGLPVPAGLDVRVAKTPGARRGEPARSEGGQGVIKSGDDPEAEAAGTSDEAGPRDFTAEKKGTPLPGRIRGRRNVEVSHYKSGPTSRGHACFKRASRDATRSALPPDPLPFSTRLSGSLKGRRVARADPGGNTAAPPAARSPSPARTVAGVGGHAFRDGRGIDESRCVPITLSPSGRIEKAFPIILRDALGWESKTADETRALVAMNGQIVGTRSRRANMRPHGEMRSEGAPALTRDDAWAAPSAPEPSRSNRGRRTAAERRPPGDPAEDRLRNRVVVNNDAPSPRGG